MNLLHFKISLTQSDLRKRIPRVPNLAVVLGSGLGTWADSLENPVVIPYKDVFGMPRSTVSGHAGRFVYGETNRIPVLAMQGRVHFYEGYSPAECVFPVRVFAAMGIRTLLLTNAAGGINTSFRAGDLMLIQDHIMLVPSPLVGSNDERIGARFPDMSEIYSRDLIARIGALPQAEQLRRGVYLQTSGPQYETPAEVAFFRTAGADAVGMSTAIEAVAAKHAGMRVAGISCITNAAAGSGTPLSHDEVKRAAQDASERFSALLDAAVPVLSAQ